MGGAFFVVVLAMFAYDTRGGALADTAAGDEVGPLEGWRDVAGAEGAVAFVAAGLVVFWGAGDESLVIRIVWRGCCVGALGW